MSFFTWKRKGAIAIENYGLKPSLNSGKESFQKESKSGVILVGIVIKIGWEGLENWMCLVDCKHSLNTRSLGLAVSFICYSSKVKLGVRLK